MFPKCFRMIFEWFSAFLVSIKEHGQHFKMHWECIEMHSNVWECVVNENWLNAISIKPRFPTRGHNCEVKVYYRWDESGE